MKPYVLGKTMTAENVSFYLSRFRCQRCKDSCCLKVSDGIVLKPHEDEQLALMKGLSQSRFKELYTFTRDSQRFMTSPCPFYSEGCSIYPHRPQVCRQYPFNRSFQGRITVNPNCPGGAAVGKRYGAVN